MRLLEDRRCAFPARTSGRTPTSPLGRERTPPKSKKRMSLHDPAGCWPTARRILPWDGLRIQRGSSLKGHTSHSGLRFRAIFGPVRPPMRVPGSRGSSVAVRARPGSRAHRGLRASGAAKFTGTTCTPRIASHPGGESRPAPCAAHADPRRRKAAHGGRAWGPNAGPGNARRRGIGRAGRARPHSIAASGNTSRPGSYETATVTMATGRYRRTWSASIAAISSAASSCGISSISNAATIVSISSVASRRGVLRHRP